MSAADDLIDTSGSRPSIKWAQMAQTAVGSVILAWVLYVVDLIMVISDGIQSAFAGVRGWLTGDDGLIGLLFSAPAEAIAVAWRTNAAWISGMGLIGFLIAIIEVVVFVAFAAQVINWSTEVI